MGPQGSNCESGEPFSFQSRLLTSGWSVPSKLGFLFSLPYCSPGYSQSPPLRPFILLSEPQQERPSSSAASSFPLSWRFSAAAHARGVARVSRFVATAHWVSRPDTLDLPLAMALTFTVNTALKQW